MIERGIRMTKNVVSKIFTGVFFLCVLIFMGFGIICIINQKKDEEKQAAHYQQMIKEGSKTLLTNEILEEDHTAYLERLEKNNKTFYFVAAIFVAVVVDFVLMIIFSTVIRGMEDGVNSASFLITLICFITAMVLITSFFVIAARLIIPKINNGVKPEEQAYYYDEIKLKDCKKVEEVVSTGSGEDRSSRTEIYYYLIDENGNEISTTKVLFDRFAGPGIYYVGKTSSDAIFSLYPDKYFELAK